LTAPHEPGQLHNHVTHSTEPQPFDERTALEELEQLADKIQLSRRQRAQAVAEFDAFVRSFREDRHAAANAALGDERRTDERPAAVSAAAHASRGTSPVGDVEAPTVFEPSSGAESAAWAAAVPSGSVAPPIAGRLRAPYVGVGLAALAVVVVGVLLLQSATAPEGPGAQPAPSSVSAGAKAADAPVVPAPPATVPPAGPPRALNIELIAIRPVWTRVVVDGRRALARLIAADERMSFGADQAIAIRAGDAGAFRLVVDGKDLGVLGRDGQIYERSFSAKAR
jgi:hypothetical protein